MKILKILFFLVCPIITSACASFGMLDKDLTQMTGSKIEYAFEALGYPDGSYPIGNDIIYVWGVNGVAMIPTTSYSNVYGNIGTTPVYGNITTSQNSIVPTNCTIKIVTTNGLISGYDYHGNLLGCERYINALHRYIHNKEKQEKIEYEEWIKSIESGE